MPKMTNWYPPQLKPVRSGVYKAKNENKYQGFAYFSTCYGWGWLQNSRKDAFNYCDTMGATQNKPWRGFTEEQK